MDFNAERYLPELITCIRAGAPRTDAQNAEAGKFFMDAMDAWLSGDAQRCLWVAYNGTEGAAANARLVGQASQARAAQWLIPARVRGDDAEILDTELAHLAIVSGASALRINSRKVSMESILIGHRAETGQCRLQLLREMARP